MDQIKKINIETFKVIKERLYSAVICDILDEIGYRNQAMSPLIRPIVPGLKLAGRAYTLLAADVHEIPEEGNEYK